jgi:hypothetical protein
MRSRILPLLIFPIFLLFVVASWAKKGTAALQSTTTPATKSQTDATYASKNPARLAQLMRGTLFPDSNVLFAATGKNPADVPPAKDPSAATNPLESTYGKWEAVENSSLAIVETANLLIVPGRLCSNGRPVPTTSPDWPKLVQGLREAGMKSYEAAQSKNQDKLTDATDVLTTACANCHVKYRDKDKLEDRCKEDITLK